MRRKLAVVLAGLVGVAVLGAAAAALWLGPGALWWSARAVASGDDAVGAALTAQLPDRELPLVVDARPDEILASPIGRAVRPELTVLARLHGVELDLLEGRVAHVVAGADARGRSVSLGGGVGLSPLLLAPLSGNWRRHEAAELAAVTDGSALLVPLGPGVVAASRFQDANWVAGILAGRAGGEATGRLAAAADHADFRADLRVDADVVRELGRDVPDQVRPLVEGLDRLRVALRAGDVLSLEVQLVHRDERAAESGQQLFFQVDAMARLVRRAGPLGGLLGGQAPPELLALARDLPDVAVTRAGATVFLRAEIDEPLLERWLQRAIDDAEARLAADADPAAGRRRP